MALPLPTYADGMSCDDRKQLADVQSQIVEQQRIIAQRAQRIRQLGGVVVDVPEVPDDLTPLKDAEDCP
jgi:hypothetical protein